MELLKVLFVVLLVQVARAQAQEDDYDYVDNHSGGFGEAYAWQPSLGAAIIEAKKQNKPVMLIVHKAWCARSSDLKKIIGSSKTIQKKSRNFIMVNTTEDRQDNINIAPDGIYFPRIIFIFNGKVMKRITNAESDFAYYHNKEKSIVDAMDRVLNKLNTRKRVRFNVKTY